MRSLLSLFAAASFTAALAGCAHSTAPAADVSAPLSERGLQVIEPVDNIPHFVLRTWHPLDDRHIVLRSAARVYLVEFAGSCGHLQPNARLAYLSNMDGLAPGNDFLVATSDGGQAHCSVAALYRLDGPGAVGV